MTTPVPNLVWLDLETTGLNPNTDQVLEIGCIVTDHAFEPIAAESWVLHYDVENTTTKIDPYVREMHRVNGLWRDCLNSKLSQDFNARHAMWREVQRFICLSGGQGSWLWGSGVGFERDWLRCQAPEVLSLFKYRNGDVNTLYGLQGLVLDGDPNASKNMPGDRTHRAMDDLEQDIAIAKEWAGLLPLLAAAQSIWNEPANHTHDGLKDGPRTELDRLLGGA